MHLTRFTDYSLRLLIYLGSLPSGQTATVEEIAVAYGISKNHLDKTVRSLAKQGLVRTVRGKGGGICLAPGAAARSLRGIVEGTEPGLELVECFEPQGRPCPIVRNCRLVGILFDAREAFLSALERHTLGGICHDRHVENRRRALKICR